MGNLPLTHKWVFDWLTSDAHTYATIAITLIAGILHPILCGIYCYRKIIKKPALQDNENKSSDPTTVSKTDRSRSTITRQRSYSQSHPKMNGNSIHILQHIIIIITLLAMLFGWIASILSLFNILTLISDPYICQPFTIIQNICWIFTKLCIYNVLIVRLQISFSGSVYEYNHKILFSAYCFVNIICIVCIIGSIFDVHSIHFITGWCLFIIPTWIILLPCCLDIICSLFALYLFIKPLKYILMHNSSENKKQNIRIIKISQLITKLILLTIIAVLSNLFGGLFFAITDIAIFTYLDTVINPICLVLMEHVNNDIYEKICKCCHVKLHSIIHYKNDSIKTKPLCVESVHATVKNDKKSSKQQTLVDQFTVSSESGLPSSTPSTAAQHSNSGNTPKASKHPDLKTIHSDKVLDRFVQLAETIENSNQQNNINSTVTNIELNIDNYIEQIQENDISSAVNGVDIQVTTPKTPLLVEGNIDDNMNYKMAAIEYDDKQKDDDKITSC